ncbi:chromosomal replication initiator protein DnaA [Patescibacteria group bacterium]|nr:chromosomal replication initiator protein DnaA [Patescibacteria group bacterium]
MENEQLWNSVLVEIELAVSKANFNTWFKDTRILKQEEGVVFVSVPNAFAKEWLYNKYHKTILHSLRTLSSGVRSVEYLITRDGGKQKEAGGVKSLAAAVPPLPLEDFYIDKENNLNPKYTFESFVVGPFNELAYAAAQAVVGKLGEVYNPLFIYGNTGHGKTHLIQAVGNHVKNQGGRKVFYVTSEKFVIDYVNSVQANHVNQFKEKYRKYDILIMDDIQFLANKEKTQEELFHLFNSLYENNKQIVFSSDKHPNFIPNLEDRLKSRFAAGMIVDIPTPDRESRLAILKTKARQSSVTVSPEVLDHLATTIEGNIRELEGMLNLLICQSELKKHELGIAEVRALIKNTNKPKKAVSVKEVTKAVASFFNIEESDIYEKTRRQEVVKPRQLVMYILRQDFNVSYPLIGQKLGGRDHTTVIHSCEKIKGELKFNTNLEQELAQIRAMI